MGSRLICITCNKQTVSLLVDVVFKSSTSLDEMFYKYDIQQCFSRNSYTTKWKMLVLKANFVNISYD